MTTQPIAADSPLTYRSSPTAAEAFAGWLKEHGHGLQAHTQRWDVSNSAL